MEVCLLGRFFNLKNGGIGRYALELAEGLESRGLEVRRVSSEDSWWGRRNRGGSLAGYMVYTGLSIRFLTPPGMDVYHALAVTEAVHLPYGKSPTVVTVHDLIPIYYAGKFTKTHYASGRVKGWISRAWFRLCLRRAARADRILSISHEVKDDLVRKAGIPPGKVRVVPNGVMDFLEPLEKKDALPRVGTLSYLDARKRIPILLEAYRKSHHRGELLVAGGTLDPEFKVGLVKAAGGDPRIRFLGFIPDKDLPAFFSSIDLFVFPSAVEGYGLPIVEALACGVPVATMEDALIPEEVKRHTFVVSREELPGLIENPPRARAEDVEWALSHRWSRVAEEVHRIYRELAEEWRSGGGAGR